MVDVSGQVLDNLLDNLDRLYDRLCTPADTQALLIASAAALSDGEWSPKMLEAAAAIHAYPKPSDYWETMRDEGWNQHALAATGELRAALADR